MELSIDEGETSEAELNDFKEKWSMRNTESVQEITLQHLETSVSKDVEKLPTVSEHKAIFDDFQKVTYKQIEKEINDCYLDIYIIVNVWSYYNAVDDYNRKPINRRNEYIFNYYLLVRMSRRHH